MTVPGRNSPAPDSVASSAILSSPKRRNMVVMICSCVEGILKEIKHECSLEELMLKLQYFGHLM